MAMDEVYQYHSERHYLQSLDLHQKREFHFNNIEKINYIAINNSLITFVATAVEAPLVS